MAIRKILQYPDPVLKQKSKKISVVGASTHKLVKDMIDTLDEAGGVGLAAPQIGVLARIVVIHLPEEDPFALINPQVVKREGERIVSEGCLSLPGFRGDVKRSVIVTVKAKDIEGHNVRIKSSDDLLAQCLEHEIDHLDGIIYIDRLESLDKLHKIEPGEEEPDGETPANKE